MTTRSVFENPPRYDAEVTVGGTAAGVDEEIWAWRRAQSRKQAVAWARGLSALRSGSATLGGLATSLPEDPLREPQHNRPGQSFRVVIPS